VTSSEAVRRLSSRLFLDTAFVLALLDRRDDLHQAAKELLPLLHRAQEVWTTEAVLIEIGNALARSNRQGATRFIESCYSTANVRVAPMDGDLMRRAYDLYSARPDKTWGLTDCVSFIVMGENRLTEALTSDEHFEQAGFRRLLIPKAMR
jgi:hypothetical protein